MFILLKKYFVFVLALSAFAVLALIKHSQPAQLPQHETLVVGLQSGYPPFEFIDSYGKVIGFDVELAQKIAEKLGKKLVIKDMEFEGEILSLKQGQIDLIMSGMNITPSRLKEIQMVPYIGEKATSMSLVFWGEIPKGVQSIEDLIKIPDAVISVELGAVPDEYLKSHYPQANIRSFQNAMEPLMDIKFGKSIANLVEPSVAQYFKQQHPQVQVLEIPLAEEDHVLGFGIGIKKENKELSHQVESAIQEFKASGLMNQLESKWFKGGL